jgi:hypothetical protein
VIVPVVVMRPTEYPALFVYQSAPSGPAVIPAGPRIAVPAYCVIAPAVVTRPMLLVPAFVNQSAPSGPAAIPKA